MDENVFFLQELVCRGDDKEPRWYIVKFSGPVALSFLNIDEAESLLRRLRSGNGPEYRLVRVSDIQVMYGA